MNGIGKSIKQLQKLQENLKNVEGERHYTMKELFNDTFMSQHTKFSSISDFLNASGLDFSSQEAFQNVDVESLTNSFLKIPIFLLGKKCSPLREDLLPKTK